MRRKSPMSNSHPPFISEGICRVQGCREEVILAKLRTTFIWQSWCPTTTHRARKTTKRRGEILCAVVSWFSSCQPPWLLVITENLNMLSWLPAGLTLGDLICDLWLKWMDQELMCLWTQWHGQISPPPPSETTHNAIPVDGRSHAEEAWITCLRGRRWELECFSRN